MIPLAHIQQWTAYAPWPDLRQVEQDLIICRAISSLFEHPALQSRIAFRGGTAINKLLFAKPLRYSEDIDMVQTHAEPIGGIIDGVRSALSWLGKCKSDQTRSTTRLVFKFTPETGGGSLRLKVEINTREHDNFCGLKSYRFPVNSDWHQTDVKVISFEPEEIFATKLRALLQRHKNRDLFDLNQGLLQLDLNREKLIACFRHYLGCDDHPISRANAEERMLSSSFAIIKHYPASVAK